jgi:hypothetical protein
MCTPTVDAHNFFHQNYRSLCPMPSCTLPTSWNLPPAHSWAVTQWKRSTSCLRCDSTVGLSNRVLWSHGKLQMSSILNTTKCTRVLWNIEHQSHLHTSRRWLYWLIKRMWSKKK